MNDGEVERVYDWRDCPVGNEAGRQRMKGVHSEWARESGRVVRGSGPFEWLDPDRPEARRAVEFAAGLEFDFPGPDGPNVKRRSTKEAARELLGITLAEIAVRLERKKGMSPTLSAIWTWYRSGYWPCAFFQPRTFGVSRLLVY